MAHTENGPPTLVFLIPGYNQQSSEYLSEKFVTFLKYLGTLKPDKVLSHLAKLIDWPGNYKIITFYSNCIVFIILVL